MHKKNRKKNMNWPNEADGELYTSEWFGAIIRYFWNFGRKKFNDLYTPKEIKKNALIGWLFKVIFVLILIYLGYRFSLAD
ncbi:hypothetical protein [Zhouia amylolytica]|uniref:hypothetical protein n=1 Tax=Zhouia amylolytica TaxID=376730 RepID=UPI0020CE5AE2|nr:hypothetical protein [Zhouia amylolytica]MCQ0111034.1 hypothetical protein [Zhouia amylolytica]